MRKYVNISFTGSGPVFIKEIRELFDTESELIFYLSENNQKILRRSFDGMITFFGFINGRKIGILYNDFRTLGSSFGEENSHRVGAFIESCEEHKLPIIYFCNSIGVRVQDGRKVFKNTFSLLPKIKKFSESNLYLTVSLGYSLGLSAVLYSLGQYRIALSEKTSFNLTGPEIFKRFFGESLDFQESCSAEVMMDNNDLVSEIIKEKKDIFSKIKLILSSNSIDYKVNINSSLEENLTALTRKSPEIFQSKGKSLKAFILNLKSGRVGLLLNPFKKANMMTVEDINKYKDSLHLFRFLNIPAVSIINTAGGDPRIQENNKNIARAIYDLSSMMIDFPHKKQGVVYGNCFGGSSLLTMPPFLGGEKILALENTNIGIMDSKLIATLLEKSKPLLEIWKKNHEKEDSDYSDFKEQGILDSVISVEELFKRLEEIAT